MTLLKFKPQTTYTVFAYLIFDKRLVSRIYKEFAKLTNKSK